MGPGDDGEVGAVEDLVQCRCRGLFGRFQLVRPIEPEVSTMTISPASPDPVWPAAPAPEQSIVTMAFTSVPPSGRNSFWYTAAVNSAMINSSFVPGQGHGDIVLAALFVGPPDHSDRQRQGRGCRPAEIGDQALHHLGW